MINTKDILETINMIREENLDIRTVTMGISLFDCITDDQKRLEAKIYDKITKCAENLVSTAVDLEHTYGIPIINKRISVTPISLVGSNIGVDGYVRLAQVLEKAANEVGVNFIGGFGALVQKGMTKGAHNLIEAIPEALATTKSESFIDLWSWALFGATLIGCWRKVNPIWLIIASAVVGVIIYGLIPVWLQN